MTNDSGEQSPMYWGPAGPPTNPELVDSWTPGAGSRNWCVYHQVLFPPHEVSPWVRFKIMTSGATIAQRLWDEREELRAEYQAAHGDDPQINGPCVIPASYWSPCSGSLTRHALVANGWSAKGRP